MDFSKKFSSQREFNSKLRTKDTLILDYESDRGRIINSAAVRRLQQKTQVFPLERNAAVRSRLTHSLEVQQTGRFIVQSIYRQLKKTKSIEASGLQDYERCFESLVEMACLMHDIGNPPFGHFGEHAISHWFDQNIDDLYHLRDESLVRDICSFEGNAQGIRIIHTLLQLNLTYSQVCGILKYTRCGTQVKPDASSPYSYLQKKVGYYKSEEDFVSQVANSLNLAVGCRHPITYVMEAADDISYCLADLEDAVEKNILDIYQLSKALVEEFEKLCSEFGLPATTISVKDFTDYSLAKAEKDEISANSQYFISLRIKCIHPLVQHASQQFIKNLEACYHGTYNAALLEDKSHAHALCEAFKNVAFKHAFCHPEVELRELQGHRIISGLLDCYKPILQASRDDFNHILNKHKRAPLIAKRMFNKLANKHIKAYQKAINSGVDDDQEFYHRCRLIQDHISGMTDQYAYDEYRQLMLID